MVAGYLIPLRNLTLLRNKSSILYCPLNIINRQYSVRNVHRANFRRNSSTSSDALKKGKWPIFLGLSLAGGGFAAYLLGKSSQEKKSGSEQEDEEPLYVHEHLAEDLALLSDFGPVPYLLVGAGSASFAAYRAIRTRDPTAKILIVGEEPFVPYMRPPLSKEMWFDEKADGAKSLSFSQWNGKNRSLFYEPEEYFFSIRELLDSKNGGVSIIRGKKVVKVDATQQTIHLDSGEKISYAKCLLATGSRPKNLEAFEGPSLKKHVTLYRNIRDFQKLDAVSKKAKKVAVIGGGLLGSELAVGLAHRVKGLDVVQVFPEKGIMGKILPEYLGEWTTEKVREEGVKVIPNTEVKSAKRNEDKVTLHLSNGKTLEVDHVIVAVGAEPDTEIAKASKLEIDDKHGGFLVNTEMEARKNLWVAGDAACFYDPNLGRRRVEHHDQAIVTGKLAGGNMAGDNNPYLHQSMFWSDLGPTVGFEAIGIIDAALPTVGVFAKTTPVTDIGLPVAESVEKVATETKEEEVLRSPNPSDKYNKGVVFYLRDDIIVGIVLWNVFSKMQVARQIVNEAKSFEDITEVAKLFELHAQPEEEEDLLK
ncbi:hypothetical protein JTE90_019461 [Oedothorax gibbosus]|uniref:Apoptosis-inducing factor 1, mitochondrial n=1 Tax=Oedothorax gibbosus TaxID=931172 RepID=A0AAV6UWV8_9ARAC|nr:hypothetical protein JTE90_019461 [Oedothorax gibbosus]